MDHTNQIFISNTKEHLNFPKLQTVIPSLGTAKLNDVIVYDGTQLINKRGIHINNNDIILFTLKDPKPNNYFLNGASNFLTKPQKRVLMTWIAPNNGKITTATSENKVPTGSYNFQIYVNFVAVGSPVLTTLGVFDVSPDVVFSVGDFISVRYVSNGVFFSQDAKLTLIIEYTF